MHGEQSKPWSAELVDSIFSGKISPVVSDQFDALLRWLGGRTTPDALAIDSELKRRDVDVEEAARLALVLLEKLLFENRDNPYTVLGLSRSATEEKVEKRYKRLVSIFHPDRQYADAEWLHRCTERLNTAYDRIRRGDTGSVSARSSGVRANGSKSRSTAKSGTSGSTSGYTYGETESDVERVVRSTLGSARSFQIKFFSGLVLVAAVVVGYLYLLDFTNPEQVYLPESPNTAVGNAGNSTRSPAEANVPVSDREIADPQIDSGSDGTSGERLKPTNGLDMARAADSPTFVDNTANDSAGNLAANTFEEAGDQPTVESEVNEDLIDLADEPVIHERIEYAEIDTHVETALVLPAPGPEATRDVDAVESTARPKPEIAEPAVAERSMIEPEEPNDSSRQETPVSIESPAQSSVSSAAAEDNVSESSKSEAPSTAVVSKATPVQRKLKEPDVINMVNRTLSRLGTGLERADTAALAAVLMPVLKVDDKTVQRSTLINEQKVLLDKVVWRRVNHKVAVTIGSTSTNPRARGVMEEKLRYKDGQVAEIARQFEFGFDIEGDVAVISSMAFWNEQRETTIQAVAETVESASTDDGRRSIDGTEVEVFLSSYAQAYSEGDAESFARHFSPAAQHQKLNGRDEIQTYYGRFFAKHDWQKIEFNNLVMQPSSAAVERALVDFVVTGKESNDKALYLAGRLELDFGRVDERVTIDRLSWREASQDTRRETTPPTKRQKAAVVQEPVAQGPESEPPTNRALPTEEIELFLDAYRVAYNAEDMANFSQKFAVDARQKRLKGREAVVGFYQEFFSTTSWHRLELATPRVEQKDKNLFEVKVGYTLTGKDVSGTPLDLSGRLDLELKRSSIGLEIERLDF